MQDMFVKELRKFLDCQGMLGIDVLTPWKPDYIVMTFTSPKEGTEGIEYFLKIKKRVVTPKEVVVMNPFPLQGKTVKAKVKAKSVRSSKKV